MLCLLLLPCNSIPDPQADVLLPLLLFVPQILFVSFCSSMELVATSQKLFFQWSSQKKIGFTLINSQYSGEISVSSHDGENEICFQAIHKMMSLVHFFKFVSNCTERKFIRSSPLSTFSQTPPSHQSSVISFSEINHCKKVSASFFQALCWWLVQL